MMIHKRYVTLLLLFASFLLFSLPAVSMAHPPSGIRVEYDGEARILEVTATHGVGDPADHFVKEFRIFVNGDMMFTLESRMQTSSSEGKAVFLIPWLEGGEEVRVEAQCNKVGTLKKVFVIE
jgi:hypothetical protein